MSKYPIAETVDGMADEAASILHSMDDRVIQEILSALVARIRTAAGEIRDFEAANVS